MGGQRVSAKIIIKSILGAFSGDYWYVTAYGMLYMLLPYLNKMTKSFEEKDIKKSLLVLSIIFPLFHMAFSSSPYSDFDLPFYLYFVALYLKRCPNNFFNRNARRGFIFSMLTIIGIESINSLLGRTIIGSSIAEVRYSTLMIVAAVFMFSFFGSLQIKTNKKINQVAKHTFGVYLIHNNPKVADCIYYNFLKLDAAFKQKTYIFALLLSVIVIYIVAWCIEFARSSISAPIKRSVLYCKYQALLEKIDYFLFF